MKVFIIASVVVAITTPASFPQSVSVGGQSPARPSVPTPTVRTPSTVLLPREVVGLNPTTWIGYGYRFEPDSNSWTPIASSQVAQINLVDPPRLLSEGTRSSDHLGIGTGGSDEFSSKAQRRRDAWEVLDIFRLAAEFGQTDAGSSSLSSFELTLGMDYEPLVGDLLNATLTTQAEAFLQSISGLSPDEQAQAWADEFGNYLAVGTLPTAEAILRVSATGSGPWQSKSAVYELREAYHDASGVSSFRDLARAATLRSVDPLFRFRGVNLSGFPLPDLADLQANPLVFDEWLNDGIRPELRVASPSNEGLLLMPMSAFRLAPRGVPVPEIGLGWLSEGADEALSAMDSLVVANQWLTPAVSNHFECPTCPLLHLDEDRNLLLERLEDFSAEAAAFVARRGQGPQALINARNSTREAREALDEALRTIEQDLIALSPAPTFDAVGTWINLGNCPETPSSNCFEGRFWAKGLGLIPSTVGDTAELNEILNSRIQVGEIYDPLTPPGGPKFRQFVPAERLLDLVVEAATFDSVAQLYDVRIRVRFAGIPGRNVHQVQVRIQDQFQRVLFEDAIDID